jgi:hypothetical protein
MNYLPGLVSNRNPSDLSHPSSKDYRSEPPAGERLSIPVPVQRPKNQESWRVRSSPKADKLQIKEDPELQVGSEG